MRKEHYLEILQEEVLPSRNNLVGEKFIFQHDNDPKNTAKVCKEFLNKLEDENKLELMIWPPQSPNLYPIELLWDSWIDMYVNCLLGLRNTYGNFFKKNCKKSPLRR